jgi:ABC-type lipoprotein export system ATPase subunit
MIKLENISKIYKTKEEKINALDNISLEIKEGEFIIIRGPSGSGKTTLLLAIGGMLKPSSGTVMIENTDIYSLSSRKRAAFRAGHIGFVFQMFHLIPYLNVSENILMPVHGSVHSKKHEDEKGLISLLGMEKRKKHKPAQLSIGERQRTATARALINQPGILLADEPTGNLDPDNAKEVVEQLNKFHKKGGTVIIVTHSRAGTEHADRTFILNNGRIEQQAIKK